MQPLAHGPNSYLSVLELLHSYILRQVEVTHQTKGKEGWNAI